MSLAHADSSTQAPELADVALAALFELAAGTGEEDERLLRGAERCAPLGGWERALAVASTAPAERDRPLTEVGEAIGLAPIELLVVALAADVERDPRLGRSLARLQAPLGGSRPTLGLLASAFHRLVEGGDPLDELVDGVAFATGMLAPVDPSTPLPECAVRLPLHVCAALRGRDARVEGARVGVRPADLVELPPRVRAEAVRRARGLQGSGGEALLLRSASRQEARSVATCLASSLGSRPVFLRGDPPDALGPWVVARKLLPVVELDLGPGDRQSVQRIAGHEGPMLLLAGMEGSAEIDGNAPLEWSIDAPVEVERRALWSIHVASGLARELATSHRHSSGRIAHLGRLAAQNARARGETETDRQDVNVAAWTGEGGWLETLAQPMRFRVPEGALQRSARLSDELDALVERCRHREGLAESLGAAATTRYVPGVRALFVGPSGTGKTLGASWLASRLDLPLYRVDLASVTSKWIGETEKHLARLLAQAEDSDVILLFDEADSMFGKRTEVQHANDRMANALTNYLLQRIEHYTGLVVMTANSRTRFDPALSRRLDFVIDFPLPGPEERRGLWLAHLGERHELSTMEVNKLASLACLSGGSIRNVVLAGAAAAQAGARSILYADLLAGLEREYRKLGEPIPVDLRVVRGEGGPG